VQRQRGRRAAGQLTKPEKQTRTYRLGAVIAERHLTFHRRGRSTTAVVVKIGRPRPWPEALHGDWMCTFQVIGLGDERVRYACGVDALQALLLAAHLQPDNLAALAKDAGGHCRWVTGVDIWSSDGARRAARHERPIPRMPRPLRRKVTGTAREPGRRTKR
jgi:hypothetical protein